MQFRFEIEFEQLEYIAIFDKIMEYLTKHPELITDALAMLISKGGSAKE